ncbi:MAG: esterase-like activity of phytase family protein, partial [Succinivibrio sp.]
NAVEVQVVPVDIDYSFYVPYKGNHEIFKSGFIPGFGSSLALCKQEKDGTVWLYGLTDRGPNADGPLLEVEGKGHKKELMPSKFFPAPDFTPKIGLIKLKDGKASLEKVIELKDHNGKKISGRPLNITSLGATGEIAIDDSFNVLPYDDTGLDSEGLTLDSKGRFFISDEYGPFLNVYKNDGTLIHSYAPEKGLPEILKFRTPNRGAEGVAMLPSGELVVMEQSVLNLEHDSKSSKDTVHFTRLVVFDPKTMNYRTYGYPIDFDSYKKPGDAKLGDIIALNSHEFLIIEQGKDKNKVMQNLIYRVDISDADDLNSALVDGFEPEFFKDSGGFKLAKKELIVNLRSLGYQHEKAEGMVLLNDRKTLIVINDNDFGIGIKVKDPDNKKAKITDYILKQDGSFEYIKKGKRAVKAKPEFEFERLEKPYDTNELFIIKLDSPL